MENEIILLISALVGITFVFLAARLGVKWLFGVVTLNLILINIFGSKLVEVFGVTTNAGNKFYACAFLATFFIIEQRDVRYAKQVIVFGVGMVIAFVVLSQSALFLVGIPSVEGVQNSLQTIFSFSPRVATASLLAFAFAQHINISLYGWLKSKLGGGLWLQSNIANTIAQLADSTLFFTIAFIDLPGPVLIQAIFAGWLIKTAVVALGTPLLYLDRYLRRRETQQ